MNLELVIESLSETSKKQIPLERVETGVRQIAFYVMILKNLRNSAESPCKL
jgi:hypothetical protein